MELPIDKKDLDVIVKALSLGGDTILYQKMKTYRDLYDTNPEYLKMVFKEKFGVIF